MSATKLDTQATNYTIRRRYQEGLIMGKDPIKVTASTVSCSSNGQHPLVYINLKNASGRCQYCGQQFIKQSDPDNQDTSH